MEGSLGYPVYAFWCMEQRTMLITVKGLQCHKGISSPNLHLHATVHYDVNCRIMEIGHQEKSYPSSCESIMSVRPKNDYPHLQPPRVRMLAASLDPTNTNRSHLIEGEGNYV
ncbi:hypothetical protein BDW66DRAFT_40738 [Aspergillus desertorum]